MDPLKVFVSSSMTELHNERAAVKRALTQLGYRSFIYEQDAHASPNTPQATYLDVLRDCDVYVGIFWNRYSKPTEEEYNAALNLDKPCFIYIKEFDIHRDNGLSLLLDEMRVRHSLRKFEDVFELADFVQKDIHSWILEQWRKLKATSPTASETRIERLYVRQKEFEAKYSEKEAKFVASPEDFGQDSDYDILLKTLATLIDVRDKENDGHSKRVAAYTVKLAQAYGVSSNRLLHIHRGALLHHIGKLLLPESILLKSGSLDERDWSMIRQHPTYAQQILLPIKLLEPAIDIPWCHHEKWDGSGYPRGLKGEEIPLSARLFAVADVFEALRSARPYRMEWSFDKVREYICEQTGKHFDPKIVEVFLSINLEDWETK